MPLPPVHDWNEDVNATREARSSLGNGRAGRPIIRMRADLSVRYGHAHRRNEERTASRVRDRGQNDAMKDLRALAAGGIVAIPPTQFDDLSARCWAQAIDTGDARYAVLADLLTGLSQWWDRIGGVPSPLSEQIDDLMRHSLDGILDAPTPQEGSQRAAALLNRVERLQLPGAEWHRRGYVTSDA